MVQVLKALVIVMGVLIVIGMGALGYGLYQKARELSPPGAEPAPKPAGKTNAPSFGAKTLAVPAGCTIAAMKPDGGRLYVRLDGPDRACAAILIVDPATGDVLGTLKAAP